MGALVVGSVLALAALAYVLWPLFRGTAEPVTPAAPMVGPEAGAIEALREIEFDQATGKLSAEDYTSLRASYTPLALAELRERDAADERGAASEPVAAVDAAEALIARVRARAVAGAAPGAAAGGTKACPSCGPRPESDALFCSDCGRFLGAACLSCGAQVTGERARFCTECGASLAA